MKTFSILTGAFALGLLAAAPAMAQTTPAHQKTASESPNTLAPTSKAYKHGTRSTTHIAKKQRTQAEGPPMVGPASGAFKQRTQAEGPPMVGPASGAFKQRTQAEGPPMVGPASGAFKQ